MLRYEFVLNKPCQNLEDLLNDTLDRLRSAELITIPEVCKFCCEFVYIY